ncbi:MAG: hypothetical protein Fur0014_08330 [Rubrivivax sp.]
MVGAEPAATDRHPNRNAKEPAMKTSTLIAASLFAFAGAAFAQEATSDAWMSAAATKSRAEVLAELQQARASGLTKSWSAGYIEPLKATASRTAVASAARSARASGELERINAEAWHFDGQRPSAKADTRLAQAAR